MDPKICIYFTLCEVEKCSFLKWMCCACMYALKVVGFMFDLFGHLVIVHLER